MPAPDGPQTGSVATGRDASPPDDGPRHSAEFYRRALGDGTVRTGELVMIRCVDGPVRMRCETFPPRLEIAHHGGVYVLEDDGPVHRWTYRFVTPT